MKVLVTGGAGFLGSSWLKSIGSLNECYGVINKKLGILSNVQYLNCNLLNESDVKALIDKVQPELVIHTVALTDVDESEREPEIAYNLNVLSTRYLSEALKGTQANFIHISTDQLYDGKKHFYKESDDLCPINVYGKTKALAEEEVRRNLSRHLILRTNFYGISSSERLSFYDWCVKVIKNKEPAFFYDNVFYTPIYVEDLIKTAMNLIGQKGTFNVVGNERTSKSEFGLAVARSLNLSASHIAIRSYPHLHSKAPRPLEMSLNNEKLLSTHQEYLHSIEQSLILLNNVVV